MGCVQLEPQTDDGTTGPQVGRVGEADVHQGVAVGAVGSLEEVLGPCHTSSH